MPLIERTSRRAFSLVELLVVVGIIGLLLAILLPTLSRARGQAAAVKCASNLRQVYVAMNLYADTANGRLPSVQFVGENPVWSKCVTPFLAQSERAFEMTNCPLVPSDELDAPTEWLPGTMSYGVNSYISTPQWRSRRNARLDTSRIIFMAEKSTASMSRLDDWATSEDGAYYTPGNTTADPGTTIQALGHRGTLARRHGGGRLANVVMFDGHVTTLNANQMKLNSGHWHPNLDAFGLQTIDFCTCGQ